MSTYILGYLTKENEEYKLHKNVLIACYEAGIVKLPEETALFFGSLFPSLHLLEDKVETKIPYEQIFNKENDMEEIWEIKIKDIPKDVETIRFINSY